MNLLNFESIKISSEKKEGKNVYPILYNKEENSYRIYNDNASDGDYVFLNNICPGNKLGDCIFRYENGIVVYVCIGELSEDDILKNKDNLTSAGSSFLQRLSYMKEHINIILNCEKIEKEFIAGIVLSFYSYEFLKKKSKENSTVSIISKSKNAKFFIDLYNAQNFSRFLGDTPANLMTPTHFVEYSKLLLKDCENVELESHDKMFMEKNNMNLFLSVAQGSKEEPRLLSIKYFGHSSRDFDIALVGKGITFDSGGISLKPSAGMTTMKGDMQGGATVVSVLKLIADNKLRINVHAIVPLTENLPSGSATKPGDVFVGMGGKSVEVDNTDAEGRLILADALSFAQMSNPKYVFDIATLTGAMCISLGESFIGFFCNDDKLAEIIYNSGIETNDPTWRMPLSSLYLPFIKSDVADLKNVGGRKGGSATAAIFLSEFVEKSVKWVHFDIAGVAFDNRNKGLYKTGMTGKGVPMMYESVKRISDMLGN